jgi:hypothetical protein
MEKYQADKKCKNCGATNWFTILKGQSVEEYISENKISCNNCECSLSKEEKEKEEKGETDD